jgi:hypothetical protein
MPEATELPSTLGQSSRWSTWAIVGLGVSWILLVASAIAGDDFVASGGGAPWRQALWLFSLPGRLVLPVVGLSLVLLTRRLRNPLPLVASVLAFEVPSLYLANFFALVAYVMLAHYLSG